MGLVIIDIRGKSAQAHTHIQTRVQTHHKGKGKKQEKIYAHTQGAARAERKGQRLLERLQKCARREGKREYEGSINLKERERERKRMRKRGKAKIIKGGERGGEPSVGTEE